jgi:hypothetical protein
VPSNNTKLLKLFRKITAVGKSDEQKENTGDKRQNVLTLHVAVMYTSARYTYDLIDFFTAVLKKDSVLQWCYAVSTGTL